MKNLSLYFQRYFNSIALGIISAILTNIPVDAASKIYFIYGPLKLSLSVDSLETFARDGKIDPELAFYLNQVDAAQQAEFRQALQTSYKLSPVQIYRFFNSSLGEEILEKIGNMITIPGGRNGKYGLRAALIESAFSSEGVSILSLLRNFPTDIEFKTSRILDTAKAAEALDTATTTALAEMEKLSQAEKDNAPSVDFSTLPDIRSPGDRGYQRQVINLFDESRQRKFYVILYQPQKFREGKTPVIIISHGLASKPEDMEKYAQHLASYGYFVALPQHPGSDSQKLIDLFEGLTGEVFDADEFINRPKDVTYLLDELEKRNQSEWAGKLNLEEVGVFGYSFGGYTALALAGAEIDEEELKKRCDRNRNSANISLLLQCQALTLPVLTYNFRDNRVKAVFAYHPVSSIFDAQGLSKIEIPVFLSGGSEDIAAPAVFEQVRSFTWLTTPSKYLALIKGAPHVDFTTLDAGTLALIESIPALQLPDQNLLDAYVKATTLAFFETYISNNEDYRIYLQSAYAHFISQEPFPFYLVTSSSLDALTTLVKDLTTKN